MSQRTPAVMFQGTGSDVGKSLIVAGLARALARRGLKVRPFKPQNMSNNAAATADGGEIGRAQALQARAAGVAASIHMNPVLLKPESERGAQVIVQGKRLASVSARDYAALKPDLMWAVLDSFAIVAADADIVLVEGAGSPAEINLRAGDIANMGFADAADLPVVLVADIERGGVIAAIVGTHAVLPTADRDRVAAFLINRFRGDPCLFDDGLAEIVRRTGRPSLGVVPWFDGAAQLPAEDVLGLAGSPPRNGTPMAATAPPVANVPPAAAGASTADAGVWARTAAGPPAAAGGPAMASAPSDADAVGPAQGTARTATAAAPAGSTAAQPGRQLRIAVPRLPRIANFDDLDPLRQEPAVRVDVIPLSEALPEGCDLVLLPGSKATIADLLALREAGWEIDIKAHRRRGGHVLGLCGGYQMLGRTISDPDGIEGPAGRVAGLGLLDVETVLAGPKLTAEVAGVHVASGAPVAGYRIHLGRTEGPDCARPFVRLGAPAGASSAGRSDDGAISPDGRVAGTYLHGLFGGDGFRRVWLSGFGATATLAFEAGIDRTLDALADHLEAHLDIPRILDIAGRR